MKFRKGEHVTNTHTHFTVEEINMQMILYYRKFY